MKEYDSDGKTTAGINIQIFGNYDRPRESDEQKCQRRIEKAWYRWRELTGVLCYKEIPTKLKVLLYKTAIKPTCTDTIKLTAPHINMVNKFHFIEDMRSGNLIW